MRNNKGLSTVVTTLIIILLVLVAVGIIWGVVNNLLSKSKGTIETSTKCFDIDVRATKIVEGNQSDATSVGKYNVTLHRSASGDAEAVYAKLVIFNSEGNTAVLDFGQGLMPLDTITNEVDSAINMTNADKIDVTAFYLDENGNENLCPSGTNTFSF